MIYGSPWQQNRMNKTLMRTEGGRTSVKCNRGKVCGQICKFCKLIVPLNSDRRLYQKDVVAQNVAVTK